MLSAYQFEQKYMQYRTMLYRIAFTYLKNNEDCEDVLQEAFFRLYTKAPEFAGEEHERRWLIRVTVNLCKNELGLFWNLKKAPLEEAALAEVPEDDRQLLSQILALPPKYKEVICLHYVAGYKCREIGEILGKSESAIKMRLAKGRISKRRSICR